MNELKMIQGRNKKSSAYSEGNKTMVYNIYSYQVPGMVGRNASTNENHNFYKSTVQAISMGRYCATNIETFVLVLYT